ncbi:MAG: hypothetical protein ACHQSE_10680 [Gemmatimonadales bacterium]
MPESNFTRALLHASLAGVLFAPPLSLLALRPSPSLVPLRSPAPDISATDRIRIREASRLAATLGDRIWPNWHNAPFALLLVTPDYEYLVGHPNPSADFIATNTDTLLGRPVFYRKRTFPVQLQATFPAVNGVSTIVIGPAELTADKTSTRWVLTVLHEHFHQYVYSQPGYYDAVIKLGLSHGDQSGMWMLNYPFPYDSARVQEAFTAMTRALLDALAQTDRSALDAKSAAFRRAMIAFRQSAPAEAATYFDFQLWQEGVARYTEIALGELAARAYTASPEFSALPDFKSYATVAATIRRGVLDDLGSMSLAKQKRVVVYSTGAADALLLDKVRPLWKSEFLSHRFHLPDSP